MSVQFEQKVTRLITSSSSQILAFCDKANTPNPQPEPAKKEKENKNIVRQGNSSSSIRSLVLVNEKPSVGFLQHTCNRLPQTSLCVIIFLGVMATLCSCDSALAALSLPLLALVRRRCRHRGIASWNSRHRRVFGW